MEKDADKREIVWERSELKRTRVGEKNSQLAVKAAQDMNNQCSKEMGN